MLHKKALTKALLTGVAILSFSTLACASEPGFYAGGALGWSAQNTTGDSSTSISKNGLGGNAFVGYQFNPYIAAEIGYLYFHNTHAKSTYYLPPGPSAHVTAPITVDTTAKDQAVDAVAKAILPLPNGFDLYAKGGAAYVDYSVSSHASAKNGGNSVVYSSSTSTHPIRPVYGVGVSYNITQNISADLGWTHLQKTNDMVPNADLVGLGLTYHFG